MFVHLEVLFALCGGSLRKVLPKKDVWIESPGAHNRHILEAISSVNLWGNMRSCSWNVKLHNCTHIRARKKSIYRRPSSPRQRKLIFSRVSSKQIGSGEKIKILSTVCNLMRVGGDWLCRSPSRRALIVAFSASLTFHCQSGICFVCFRSPLHAFPHCLSSTTRAWMMSS